jgi:ADP-heptose:LPS heptosyltransferase
VKYLFVRPRLIGDVVFTTPLLRALRRTRPNAHITYLVEPLAAPVVRNNPHLDEVLIIPKRSGLRRWVDDLVWARLLRARRFDVAIDLHGGPRASFLTWASGAPMRVGYRMAGHSWMYTHLVDRADDLLPRHSVLKQWDLLAPFGIDPADPARDAVEMTDDPDARARIDGILRDAGFVLGTNGAPMHQLVVMHVSAGNPFRRWPQQAFADTLVDLALRDPARRFLVTSGPSDADAARAIVDMARARLGPAAGAAIAHGQFEVAELRALASLAAVYIGGDSGPLHIAATTETPIVALFGPTLAERSMPWRDPRWFAEAVDGGRLPCRPCHQRQCAPGDFRCLTGITPDRVVAAVERALRAAKRPAGEIAGSEVAGGLPPSHKASADHRSLGEGGQASGKAGTLRA